MRLPTPKLEHVSLAALIHRVVQLESRLPVAVASSEDVAISVDAAQIEQALINLVRNAVEAATSPDIQGKATPSVQVSWTQTSEDVVISITDSGPD